MKKIISYKQTKTDEFGNLKMIENERGRKKIIGQITKGQPTEKTDFSC